MTFQVSDITLQRVNVAKCLKKINIKSYILMLKFYYANKNVSLNNSSIFTKGVYGKKFY